MYREKTRLLQNLIITAFAASICFIPAISLAQSEVAPDSSYADSAYSGARVVNQPAGDKSDQKGPSRGDYALQFRIGSDFTLHSFSGALISFQRTLSDRNAIRWGLSLDGTYNRSKNGSDGLSDETHTKYKSKRHTERVNISVSMNYLWYMPINQTMRFYYGIGPTGGFIYLHSKDTDTQNTGLNTSKSTTSLISGTVGIIGTAGVEWFVKPHVSLTAEYAPDLTANHSNRIEKSAYTYVFSNENEKHSQKNRNERSSTNINLGSTSVRFGISIYF